MGFCLLSDWVSFIHGDEAPSVLPAAVAQDAQLAEGMSQVTCRVFFFLLFCHEIFTQAARFFCSHRQPTPTQSTVARRNIVLGFCWVSWRIVVAKTRGWQVLFGTSRGQPALLFARCL